MEKAISQMAMVPTAKVLVFTGGETTLRKQMLLKGIRMASQSGLITRIVTNAWWATSPEKADKWVKELKAAGLIEINTSYDDYHAEFAPIENTERFVEAALKNHLRVAVGTIIDEGASYTSDVVKNRVAEYLGMTRKELERKVFFLEDYPTPSGRARQFELDGNRLPEATSAKFEFGCNEIIKTFSIHPNGDVKVCCGQSVFETADLTAGNLLFEDLQPIIEKAQSNLFYLWINASGPKRILETLGVHGSYSSVCHACREMFLDHKSEAIDHIRRHKDEILVNEVLLNERSKRLIEAIQANKEELFQKLREN